MTKLEAILQKLVPAFLRRIDEWLLVNYPLIWHTKVHYFIFYSLILGNLFFWGLGHLVPVELTNIPTTTQIFSYTTGVSFLLGGIAISWLYLQFRQDLGERSFWQYLVLSVIGGMCLFSLRVNTVVFVLPIIDSIDEVIADDEFYKDYEFHDIYGFGNNVAIEYDLSMNSRIRLQKDLIKYGFQGKITFENWNWIQNTLQKIWEAKAYKKSKGSYHDRYKRSLLNYLYGAFVICFLLQLFVFLSTFWKKQSDLLLCFFNRKLIRIKYPMFVKKIDESLAIKYPIIWASQIHIYFFEVIFWGIGIIFLLPGDSLLIFLDVWEAKLTEILSVIYSDSSILFTKKTISLGELLISQSALPESQSTKIVNTPIYGILLLVITPIFLSFRWIFIQVNTKIKLSNLNQKLKLVPLFYVNLLAIPITFLIAHLLKRGPIENLLILAFFFSIGISMTTSWIYLLKSVGLKYIFLALGIYIAIITFIVINLSQPEVIDWGVVFFCSFIYLQVLLLPNYRIQGIKIVLACFLMMAYSSWLWATGCYLKNIINLQNQGIIILIILFGTIPGFLLMNLLPMKIIKKYAIEPK